MANTCGSKYSNENDARKDVGRDSYKVYDDQAILTQRLINELPSQRSSNFEKINQNPDELVNNKFYEENNLPFQNCTEFDIENEYTNVNKKFWKS